MITMSAEDLCALLSMEPAESPETQADIECLRAAIRDEPEHAQHANLAGAAAAVIERLRNSFKAFPEQLAKVLGLDPWTSFDETVHEVSRMQTLYLQAQVKVDRQESDAVRMDEGARQNMAEALGRPELKMWAEIEVAARELVAERERTLLTLAAHSAESLFDAATRVRAECDEARSKLDQRTVQVVDRRETDAVPVLRVGDVNADGVTVVYGDRGGWNPLSDAAILVGDHRYAVHSVWSAGPGEIALRIRPIDGAPVIPTGDGLTIARAGRQTEDDAPLDDWDVPMPDRLRTLLLAALDGEVDDMDPATTPIAAAVMVIERLKDDRARHEQRRLDLAEKMGLGPAISEWNYIAVHAERYGLLSEPVRRFALAMQATIDVGHEAGSLNAEYDVLDSVLSERMRNGAAVAPALRVAAANLAVYCMSLAKDLGDLDTFDAVAEIAAARGKSAD